MASLQWDEEYVRLALRMERLFPGFVDGYFGPPALKASVEAEGEPVAQDLLQAARDLAGTLDSQGFAPDRTAYLHKQVAAMVAVCRKLTGEALSLQEEVRLCFDITPEWTPEAEFEEALALYEQGLPGRGPVAERLSARRSRFELPGEKAALVQSLLEQVMAEVRRRTLAFVDLPEGEGVAITTVTEQPWGAYNWYLGNYRSRIELNVDLPTNVSGLIDTMAHEGYPGHHTESVLKEHLLYRGKGYLEQSVQLINTPQCVISEGIATLAADMIFAPGEARDWLTTHVYPQAGIDATAPGDQTLLNRAAHLLAGVRGNAVIMLHAENRPADEVARYLMKYGLMPQDRARKALSFLESPLWRSYTFTYFYGRRLMEPLLQGANRLDVFRRLLTEQVYPSLLLEWAKA